MNKDDDGTTSIAPSAISKVTHKTANGMYKRHCMVCGKLIGNWTEHKKKVHNGVEVSYITCNTNCS
jgi:hypothetical protein